MFRLIAILICILLSTPALAQERCLASEDCYPQTARLMVVGGGVPVPIAACVEKDSDTDTNAGELFAADADRQNISFSFAPTATYYLCEVKVQLYKAGSYTGVLTMYVYATTGTAGEPTGNALATSTNTVSGATDLTTTPGALESFTFDETLQLSSGTRYAFVLYSSTTSGAAFPYIMTHAETGHHQYRLADATPPPDGGTWTLWNANVGATVTIYGK